MCLSLARRLPKGEVEHGANPYTMTRSALDDESFAGISVDSSGSYRSPSNLPLFRPGTLDFLVSARTNYRSCISLGSECAALPASVPTDCTNPKPDLPTRKLQSSKLCLLACAFCRHRNASDRCFAISLLACVTSLLALLCERQELRGEMVTNSNPCVQISISDFHQLRESLRSAAFIVTVWLAIITKFTYSTTSVLIAKHDVPAMATSAPLIMSTLFLPHPSCTRPPHDRALRSVWHCSSRSQDHNEGP